MTDKTPTADEILSAQAAIGVEKAPPEQSIIVQVDHNPVIVLLEPEKRDLLFTHIEGEIAEFTHDLTTSAGREATRRFAAKITKTKTAADKAGLEFTEDARKKIADINAARKVVKDRLTEMADRARQPLTDWENAEANRIEECERALRDITSMGVVPLEATVGMVKQAIEAATAFQIDPTKFQGMTESAIKARNHTLELLKAALVRIEQQEAERAELARLREEAEARRLEDEARAAREREEAAAREAQERQEREAREAEERAKREAEEKAERQRAAEEAAAKAAAEAAQRESEEKARKEREEAERAQAAALAAEQAKVREAEERAAAAEREAQAERDRIAAEEAERQRAAAAEEARRKQAEADQAHRTRCKREAKDALMTVGMSEDHAQKAVLLIMSGEVPRVSLDWAATPKVAPKEAADQPALV